MDDYLVESRRRAEQRNAEESSAYIERYGTVSPEDARLQLQVDASNMSSPELLLRAATSGSNQLVSLMENLKRKAIAPDPTYNFEDHKHDLMAGMPLESIGRLQTARSLEEARAVKADILENEHDMQLLAAAGFRGAAAQVVASLFDADSALTMLSGGALAGTKVAKVLGPLAKTRVGSAVALGAEGAAQSAVVEGIGAVSNPSYSPDQIPQAILGGFVLGGGLGALTKADLSAAAAVKDTRRELDDTAPERYMGDNPIDNNLTNTTIAQFSHGTAGAASTGTSPQIRATVGDAIADQIDEAIRYNTMHGLAWQQNNAFSGKGGKQAKWMYDAIRKSPLATDADRFWNSNSAIGTMVAHKLLESPAGIWRNNLSGDSIGRQYHTNLMHPVADMYPKAFDAWLKEKNYSLPSSLASVRRDIVQEFENELFVERQFRYHDGILDSSSSKAIRDLSDSLDVGFQRGVLIQKGRNGEIPLYGSETLEHVPGWMRQIVDGRKLAKLVSIIGEDKIVNELADNYSKLQGLSPTHATRFAKAVVSRANSVERGIDTNLLHLLQGEGEEFLREYLGNSMKMTKTDIEDIITGLRGTHAEHGKLSHLKARRDVDMRRIIPGTPYRLLDIYDTDILGLYTQYSRSVAMNSAAARHGIQPTDWHHIKEAVKQEELANGGRTLKDEQLDALEHIFRGRPLAGGLNPWVRRTLALTRLALLNGAGLTQLAETGVTVAAVGWESYVKTAPQVVRDMLSGKSPKAMKELADYSSAIAGEHNIVRYDLMLDEMQTKPGQFPELELLLDKLLIRGQRVQGIISGFFKIQGWQHQMAGRGLLHRLGRLFTDNVSMSAERLADIGMDKRLEGRVKKYFTDGTVVYGKDGAVEALNLDKWKPGDVTEFMSVFNRFIDQVVQKARHGEDWYWMHQDVGALFMSLKSFPLIAMQKQLLRHARLMDAETTMAFMYSLVTAGAVYTATQGIKGRTDKLDAVDIAKGAFSLNNLTGILPMLTDPIASMLGMDNLRFNQYGTQMGYGGDILSLPAPFQTLNRVAHAPESWMHVLSGDYNNGDINSIQATPLIGNLYGFSYLFNSMKKHGETEEPKTQEELPDTRTFVGRNFLMKLSPQQLKDMEAIGISVKYNGLDEIFK